MRKPPLPLNKYRIQGQLWLAADIHLGPHAPKTAAAFYAFLARAAQQADALILAGDIFEAWVGDDVTHRPEPWLQEVISAFQQCSKQIPLYLMRGNRDFLLGPIFAQQVGAHCLPDEVLIETEGRSFVLVHGDQLCTEDKGYQRYRQVVHQPWIQRLFLMLPLAWRNKIAASLRQRSQHKPYQLIGDIHAPSAQTLLTESGQNLLVHGHTHQPAIHALNASGTLQRIVIPDWEYDHSEPVRGGWVAVSPTGEITLHQSSHPAQQL